jgi:hypothetical protein
MSMATPISVVAFKFMFDAKKMRELLDSNPAKVVCVVSIEDATTTAGRKVGALKIIARGPETETLKGGFEIEGCPHPPCDEQ